MSAENEILSRADAWQRAIEARDPVAAAKYLADDYALVVTNPDQAAMPPARGHATTPVRGEPGSATIGRTHGP